MRLILNQSIRSWKKVYKFIKIYKKRIEKIGKLIRWTFGDFLFKREASDDTIPWVEKYRPNNLGEIIGHEWIVKALRTFVDQKSIPHMIFTGPAGTGKTSAAVAIVKDLLGKDFTPDQILELNASDNVRMDTVQNEIKTFTLSSSFMGKQNFKLIILDESDNIPTEPQQALRRIIEKSPPNIKFIFMCNYENRLIDPIKSRCALLRFTQIPKTITLIHKTTPPSRRPRGGGGGGG
jgi:DNA polymerase III gamma/tau subunit